MTYAPRGETIRFVWRNIRFAFAGFGLHRGAKRNGQGRGPRVQGVSDRGPLSARCAGPPIAIRLKVAARKKLRKGAAKPMKSLVRVNLCARLADGLDIAGPLALSLPF